MNPTATDIESWANKRDAQGLLPILIRRLIQNSLASVKSIRFPGGDSVLIGGFDGELDVEQGNAWVPGGSSVWEVGCDKQRKAKADSDYGKRTRKVKASDRRKRTFVFVTARRWPAKDTWVKRRKAEKKWRDVRCFDADDLEQWLEQAPAAAAWLSEKIGLPTAGFLTAQRHWERWSHACDPTFPAELVLAGREQNINALVDALNRPPAEAVTVAADSREEALAFVCAALVGKPAADRILVAEATAPVERLHGTPNLVLALESEAVERRLGSLNRQAHIIVPRARGETSTDAQIVLDSIRSDVFERCLEQMGLSEDERDVAARESGRSLSILRRRWAVSPALREPVWSGNTALARTFVPFALAGAWSGDRARDLEALAGMANRTRDEIERDVVDLLALDDSPVIVIGSIHRVVSQIEALFAVAKRVTRMDLDRFFDVAESTLSVRDPALDLPEDKRWMANVFGKEHPFSGVFLRGIGNALILLAIHGDEIFGRRLNVSVSGKVHALVRKLLTDLDGEQWLSIRSNLQLVAEAAPDAFLGAIERDLARPEPGIGALMGVQGEGITGTCLRTELLWALELLAWNPANLHRVADILARLSRYPMKDNWGNKPLSSLYSFFRPWLPKTAAPVQERIDIVRRLCSKYPHVGFDLCIRLVDHRTDWASDNARPRWRDDATGVGRSATQGEYRQMVLAAAALLTNQLPQGVDQLNTFVLHLPAFPPDRRTAIWDLVDSWIESRPTEDDKAAFRETIRRHALSRRVRGGAAGGDAVRARAAYEKLQPSELIPKHRWLFDNPWVEWSSEELETRLDHDAREAAVERTRSDAIHEVWDSGGFDEVIPFATAMNSPHIAADILVKCNPTGFNAHTAVSKALAHEQREKADAFMRGVLAAIADTELAAILVHSAAAHAAGSLDQESLLRIFQDAPPRKTTWDVLGRLPAALAIEYWQRVQLGRGRWTAEEMEFVVRNLLDVNRPRTAFYAAHLNVKDLSGETVLALLGAFASGAEATVPLPQSYYFAEAFKRLDDDPAIDRRRIAQMEFYYAAALVYSERGPAALYDQISKEPRLFVQMLAYMFRRNDEGTDPSEWQLPDGEGAANIRHLCFEVLHHWQRLPGQEADGKVDPTELSTWVAEARRLCADHGRPEVGDTKIGEVLAHAPADDDGTWPCLAVRDVLEQIGSESMFDGLRVGVFNKRGVTSRCPLEGGRLEREEAGKFDAYARRVEGNWPRTAAALRAIADNYRREGEWQDSDARLNDLRDL